MHAQPETVEILRWYGGREQLRYLYCLEGTALIHPRSGWAIHEGSVILESVVFGSDHQVPLPTRLELLAPKAVSELEEAGSVMFGWENYWHFTNETLGQLLLLRDQGFPRDLPIIVPSHVKDLPYVAQIIDRLRWPKREQFVYLDGRTYLKVKKLWFCKPTSHDHLPEAREMIATKAATAPWRKTVILRRGVRAFANEGELEEQLGAHGFEFADTARLSLAGQIALFQESAVVVGVHGAGLTNLLYSQPGARLVEIFPPKMVAPHFFWLCQRRGLDYSALLGETRAGESVEIDPGRVLDAVSKGHRLEEGSDLPSPAR